MYTAFVVGLERETYTLDEGSGSVDVHVEIMCGKSDKCSRNEANVYLYSLYYTAVTVLLEQSMYTTNEGAGTVDVCVEIVIAGGSADLECEIVASLGTVNGTKAGKCNGMA